jgi:DNA-binding NarL/FixJ family response regulator
MTKHITHCEMKILQLLCKGLTTKEIAKQLQRSPRTIETHIKNVKIKLNITTRSELISHVFDKLYVCKEEQLITY